MTSGKNVVLTKPQSLYTEAQLHIPGTYSFFGLKNTSLNFNKRSTVMEMTRILTCAFDNSVLKAHCKTSGFHMNAGYLLFPINFPLRNFYLLIFSCFLEDFLRLH